MQSSVLWERVKHCREQPYFRGGFNVQQLELELMQISAWGEWWEKVLGKVEMTRLK